MRNSLWIVVLITLAVAPFAVYALDSVTVPLGTAPILDGTLSDKEWDDALAVALNVDFTLYLKSAEGSLYLGIQATTRGVPSPLILRDGEVHVLHASAALGTGIYTQQEDSWILRQSFVWQCRASNFSSAAVAARNSFLETEGWVATIGYLGTPTMFEYQIHLDAEPLQMLFLFLETTTPFQVMSWPIRPESATGYLALITGPIPSEATFDLDSWALLLPSREEDASSAED